MSNRRACLCLALAAVFLSSLSYAVTADRITGTLTGATVALRGNVHHKALPQYDRGPLDPATPLGTITLQTVSTPAQQKALVKLLAQQQDPKSPSYHKWLTPEQWADRFGMSQHDIQQIVSWLKQQGFTMVHAARGRNWVSFTGTAAQVEAAFNTKIHRYNVNGELHYANSTAPSVPAAIAGVVTGIRGLHDFRPRPMGIRKNAGPRPMYDSSEWGDLIAPGDVATIYDFQNLITSGNDGTGYKLAVMGQTEIYLADLNDFRSGFGLPSLTCATDTSGVITACSDPHLQYVLYGASPGLSVQGDIAESDLDLEWASASAPGAQLIFVVTTDTFTSFQMAIDNDLAPVISLSYGVCEFGDNNVLDPSTGLPGSDETLLMQANSEGITFVNSSGDSGAAECDDPSTVTSTNLATQGLAVSYPASSPEVTGAGGTAIPLANLSPTYWGTTNGPNGGTALSYIPEQAWNDDLEFFQLCQGNPGISFCQQSGNGVVNITSEATAQQVIGIGSGGGGASNCALQSSDFSSCVSGFPQPSWQTVSINGQSSARFSPDISLLATPNFPGYIFCTPQSELGLSGSTSSCSPGGTAGITNALSLTRSGQPDPSIIGGTSVSAPVLAGIVTLLNQYLNAAGGLGNINPMLYSVAASSPGAFHPVTSGDSNVSCQAATPNTMPTAMECPSSGVFGFSASNQDSITSYNLVTGLGSVDANNLAVAWKAAAAAPGFTLSTAPSPASLSAAAGVNTNSATITITPQNGFDPTATPVTLACNSGTLPTGAACQFSAVSATSATLVITTSSGMTGVQSASVIVTGTAGSASGSTAVSLSVAGSSQSFTLQPLGGNPQVAQGATVSLNIHVNSANGFNPNNTPLTYKCTTTAPETTCIYPTGPNNQPNISVQLQTTAPTAAASRATARLFYAALLPGLLGVVFAFGPRKRPFRGMRVLGLIMVLGSSTLWLGSCGGSSGGGSSNQGTPVGSYSVTVSATAGSIQGTPAQFTLTVVQ